MEKGHATDASVLKPSPMNGGDGLYSYADNSRFQGTGLDSAKTLIYEEVTKKLDAKKLPLLSKCFNIADLACSVGPNTFAAVDNIIQAVELKYKSDGLTDHQKPEFHVFFNDQIENDFNTLFKSLPLQRVYFAAGVPGTFHGRLFPRSTLHFVHCSYGIHWLSRVPEEVEDRSSPAWNKGRIHYGSKEVETAYAAQFAKDMESFLQAREEELVCGGLMALLLPCIPNGENPSKCITVVLLELVGCCLMNMAKKGLLDEAKVDSFNIPTYVASPEEVDALIKRNGRFKIERMEQLARSLPQVTRPTVEMFTAGVRAILEGSISQHFGWEIVDELFEQYVEKVIESCLFSNASYAPMLDLFVVLKRIDD